MYLCARPDRLTTYKFVMNFYAFHSPSVRVPIGNVAHPGERVYFVSHNGTRYH